MNANEPYSIVNPARIVGNFGQTVLVTSFEIYAITRLQSWPNVVDQQKFYT